MSYNEAETRYYLIDPILREKGYNDRSKLKLETPAPVEAIGYKGRRRAGGGRTDYLLCVQAGDMPKPLPVGVLEAKKEGEDLLKGMQQAKGYSECNRFSVQYVFASNGHLYGEYDKTSGLQTGPHNLKDHFPCHADLTSRFAKDTGIDLGKPESVLLFMADSPAYPKSRYYQDAAIRACFEKILISEQNRQPARILLSLATGAGKTIIAANLLWRLHEAQRLPKPALFLCDRDELREQGYNKLKAVFGDNARLVTNSKGENTAKDARVHIATYQTLGLDDEENEAASFLSEHYPPDAFSAIIIDECHRSAWGRWSEVLLRNPNAIQIGLTATPRQLRESKNQSREDSLITANNLKYFGEPVYEYTLIQAQEDGYLAACEIVKRRASIDGKTFTSDEVLKAKPVDAKTGRQIRQEEINDQYTSRQFDNQLVMPERIAAMCEDLFKQLCLHGGPEQKVIIFCTRELHADRVAMQMNNLYSKWCKQEGLIAKEPPGKQPQRYKPVFSGTVFYNPMRIMIGSIAFVDDDDEPGITSPDYVALQGKAGLIDSRWFYYWLRSPYGEHCINSLARGAVRERMLFNRLAEGLIMLPSYPDQVRASKALATLKPVKYAIQKQLHELNKIPERLLAQAFEIK